MPAMAFSQRLLLHSQNSSVHGLYTHGVSTRFSTDPNVAYASQDDKVLSRFLMIYTIIPAIFVILQFIPILFYDMTGEKKARITAALAEKREAEKVEEANEDNEDIAG